jgi:hypothetical protein
VGRTLRRTSSLYPNDDEHSPYALQRLSETSRPRPHGYPPGSLSVAEAGGRARGEAGAARYVYAHRIITASSRRAVVIAARTPAILGHVRSVRFAALASQHARAQRVALVPHPIPDPAPGITALAGGRDPLPHDNP